jgi:DNA-binding NarL/FixJ family response regulator
MQQAGKHAILIVDDHLLVLQGLKQILSHEFRDIVLAEAGTAQEALARIKSRPWRLVILDVSLPDGDGFSVLREICALGSQTAVLMLSIHTDSLYASRSLQLGAAGYISKSASRSDLLKAIRNVLDGKRHFDESAFLDGDHPGSATFHANLSPQEWKVLLALASGRATGEVAAEFHLSAKTVSTYKRRLLDKLGLKSTADLVRYVIEQKLC